MTPKPQSVSYCPTEAKLLLQSSRMPWPPLDDFVTLAQAARLLGVTPNSVRCAVKSGRLPAEVVQIPRLMIRREALRQYVPAEWRKRIGRIGGPAAAKKRWGWTPPTDTARASALPDASETPAAAP